MSTLRHAAPGGHIGLHQGFPSTAERVFPAAPVSVPAARQFAAETLAMWGLDHVTDDVVLVADELAANAVREGEHSPQPEILIRLACSPRFVFIQAGDHILLPPPRPGRRVRRMAEHGRGLPIARALSHRLAWYEQDGWKIVWAAIPIPPARPHLSGRQCLGVAA
jgi:anti-sigma regulatory factor (Ser/Thr protein kinase)